MNIPDFCYMWQGKVMQPLPPEQAHLLSPVDIRHGGKKRALLLLHGFSSSPAVYRQLLPAFHGYDTLVAPVLPGHGESIAAFSKVKAADWVTLVDKTCESLVNSHQEVDVMGLSLGGLLANTLSQRFPLRHLYLLAPALALQMNIALGLTAAKMLKHLGFRSLRNRAGNLHNNQHAELAYRQLPLTAIIEILTFIQSYAFIPPACPTDLFLGHFDKVVNSTLVAKYFADAPHLKTHWLMNSAHVLPLDGDLKTIITCVNQS